MAIIGKKTIYQNGDIYIKVRDIPSRFIGKRVVFWLNSNPVRLGEGIVTVDGTVSLTAKIPCGVPAGDHTVTAEIDGVLLDTPQAVTILEAAECPATPNTGFALVKPLQSLQL